MHPLIVCTKFTEIKKLSRRLLVFLRSQTWVEFPTRFSAATFAVMLESPLPCPASKIFSVVIYMFESPLASFEQSMFFFFCISDLHMISSATLRSTIFSFHPAYLAHFRSRILSQSLGHTLQIFKINRKPLIQITINLVFHRTRAIKFEMSHSFLPNHVP